MCARGQRENLSFAHFECTLASRNKNQNEHQKDECKNNKNVIQSCKMCAIGAAMPYAGPNVSAACRSFCVYSFLICLSSKCCGRNFSYRFFARTQFEIISNAVFCLLATLARASKTSHSLFSAAIICLKIKLWRLFRDI